MNKINQSQVELLVQEVSLGDVKCEAKVDEQELTQYRRLRMSKELRVANGISVAYSRLRSLWVRYSISSR